MNSKRKEQVMSVIYMIIIASAFTGMVSGVNVLMRSGIEKNRKARTAQGILEAFNLVSADTSPEKMAKLFEKRISEEKSAESVNYTYTESDGTLRGYAFPLEGEGYWGPIYGFIAVGTAGKEIIGVSITRHTETPGLGGRITEKWFTDQFKGKNLDPKTNGGTPLRLVQSGKKKNPQDVDAISGASGTSNAFEVILQNAYQTIQTVLKEH